MNDLTYTLISFAPLEIDRQFEEVKKRFDLYIDQPLTQSNGIICKNHAHITLKSAFYLREKSTEQQLVEILSQFSQQQITVTASSPEVFHTQKHGEVVVAVVDDNPELILLHNRLESVLASVTRQDPDEEKHAFLPHLSFFYQVPRSQLDEVKKYCEENLLPLWFQVQTLSLLRQVNGVKGERTRVKDFPQI